MHVRTYHRGPHLLVPGKDAGDSFLQCVLLSDANPSVLLAFLSLFIPPPLRSVKNETLSCSETVWGAAVLQFSDFWGFFPKLTLGNAYVHHFCNVTLSFSENSGFSLCVSPSAGCTAPGQQMVELLLWEMEVVISLLLTLMQEEEVARHIPALSCRNAEETVLRFSLLDGCQWWTEMHYS